MQVKKFEATTIQEALEHIKKEFGPEAIILQTKQNKKGFGLMGKGSVEVTAAISDRSMTKKETAQIKLPQKSKDAVSRMSAQKQADLYDRYTAPKGGSAKSANSNEMDNEDMRNEVGEHLERTLRASKDRVQIQKSAPPVSARAAAQAQELEDLLQDKPARTANWTPTPAGRAIEDEVKQLKRMIEEMKVVQEEGAGNRAVSMGFSGADLPAGIKDALEQLILNGVDRRFALPLLKKVQFNIGDRSSEEVESVLDGLAQEMLNTIQVDPILDGIQSNTRGAPSVVTLVGPTGVGKTTTLSKLAAEAVYKKNLKVGLINLDQYKTGASVQLDTYAKILKCPFRMATNPDELKRALQDFKSLDLVLVDTAGRSQKDPLAITDMEQCLKIIDQNQIILTLSATTREMDLYDAIQRFSSVRPRALIVSKVDDASTYGVLYNLASRAKLPLAYFTTGQRVPEDIESATAERVVSLVMDL